MIIRVMRQEDVGAVCELEREAITPSWSVAQISSELDIAESLHLVAEQSNALFGYTFFRICGHEAELLRIGVDATRRRSGVGAALLRYGLRELAQKKVESCFLEVRISNTGAQLFYESFGFQHQGVRPKYYGKPTEDAALMRKNLTSWRG